MYNNYSKEEKEKAMKRNIKIIKRYIELMQDINVTRKEVLNQINKEFNISRATLYNIKKKVSNE